MELMIDYHLLPNALTNINTTDPVVKETYPENVVGVVVVVVTLLLEATGVVETDGWMTEGEQLMMSILY